MANSSGNNFFKQLKEVVTCFYRNGELLDKPVGSIANKLDNDKELIDFFKQFVNLLVNTRMLCNETKIYITDMYITYKGVCDKLYEITGKEPNFSTVQTKTYADKVKILRYFGDSFLVDLIYYKDKNSLGYLTEQLEKAYAKYGNSNLLRLGLALKIPDSEEMKDSLPDEQFKEFISIIAPYTKSQMQFIESNLDKDALAYCRYLLNNTSLKSEEEFEKRELLINLLS